MCTETLRQYILGSLTAIANANTNQKSAFTLYTGETKHQQSDVQRCIQS